MVRSKANKGNKARSVASIAINMMLVVSVAAGAFYALSPVVA